MYELVYEKKNDIFTDSMVIAKGTDNQHHSVTRHIREYPADFEEFGEIRFMDLKSINPAGGRPEKIYLLNEQQATLLMTYLGNSEIVRRFKINLVKEFYRMRQALMERQSTDWLESRRKGKLVRRYETDAIQYLIPYAQEQGSKNAEKLYLTYSKLVNKSMGIESGQRDKLSRRKLITLELLEDMITNTIREEMGKGVYYKTIYQICKNKAAQVTGLLYISA